MSDNEKDGGEILQTQVDELYRKYLPKKLRLLANYDLLYNKRHRSAAAVFERYLKINPADVSTELSLASSYVEIEEYDKADHLLAKIVARSKRAANLRSDGLSVLSDLQTKIFMGRGQYENAQQRFQSALDRQPRDLFYTLGFLYCAALRDVNGQKPGEFDAAQRQISAWLDNDRLMSLHIDALRAFVLVKQRNPSAARAIADKWRIAGSWGGIVKWSNVDESLDRANDSSGTGKQYVPIVWRRFPGGSEIIETWNRLLERPVVATSL